MDLGELDLNTPLPAEPEVEEEKKEDKPQEKTLADLLVEYPGAPDKVQLEKWKQEHGEALLSGLSETELFVFRPMTRGEYITLQTYLSKSKDVSQYDVEVKVVSTCVLWASPDALKSLEKKAGTYSTLNEQIMQASNFMNAAYVGQLVVRL